MRVILRTLFFAAVFSIPLSARAADEEAKAPLFAEPKKDWAWDEDKRFDFLIERLASLEASLDAVNAAIAKASGKKGTKLSEAKRMEENNTMMDRKGGGPMRWSEFYGTNAEKFFYHPVDPNTTYRTDTLLRQMGKAEDDKYEAGIPSRQSLPVHQRPPQFDYIYKANRDARDRAEEEAAKLAGKVEKLTERRIELEREQAELWCQLAFRAIQRLDIPRKPVLRFRLVSASSDTADVQKADALSAAARFLAVALLIIDKAEEDQATALGNVKDIVTKARNDFDDALLNTDAVAEDVADNKTTLGKYVALAKLLDDTSSNLSDSYEVAMEGDRSDDLARKDRFRGLLQKSLVEYAQIILALDELAGVMKTDWKVKIDTTNKTEGGDVSWGPARVKVADSHSTTREDKSDSPPAKGKPIPLIAKNSLKGWHLSEQSGQANWMVKNGVLFCTAQGASLVTDEGFADFDMHVEFSLPSKANSGIFLQGHYELQLIDSDFGRLRPEQMCGAIYGVHPGMQAAYAGPNKWNTLDVGLRGQSVTVKLNGKMVVSEALLTQPTASAPDDKVGTPGPLVIQSYGGGAQSSAGVAFRNFTLTPIK
jgi:hypothetical protein